MNQITYMGDTINIGKIVVACSAWVALCVFACIAVCTVIYTAKPEDK